MSPELQRKSLALIHDKDVHVHVHVTSMCAPSWSGYLIRYLFTVLNMFSEIRLQTGHGSIIFWLFESTRCRLPVQRLHACFSHQICWSATLGLASPPHVCTSAWWRHSRFPSVTEYHTRAQTCETNSTWNLKQFATNQRAKTKSFILTVAIGFGFYSAKRWVLEQGRLRWRKQRWARWLTNQRCKLPNDVITSRRNAFFFVSQQLASNTRR